jgi:hypothetical protein
MGRERLAGERSNQWQAESEIDVGEKHFIFSNEPDVVSF